MKPPVRVLVVDDQKPFRSAARMVIEMTDGFELAGEALDGEEALALVEVLQPDLVLMDIQLPGMDGIEATRRLLGRHPTIRVVAVSTYDEHEQRALAAGAVAFVPKSEFGPAAITSAGSWPR